jgi:hypothetical protein
MKKGIFNIINILLIFVAFLNYPVMPKNPKVKSEVDAIPPQILQIV